MFETHSGAQRPIHSPIDQPRLNLTDYKTLALASIGGALEYYDFVIFVFFTAVIGKLFFPPSIPEWLRQAQTFGIFAAGYVARPLGGLIIAHFGDLFGRKRMFMWSVCLMALPTLAIGLMPTYSAIGLFAPLLLLALRIMQGAAVGGEVPGAWVFMSEHVPQRRVGCACATVNANACVGLLLGSLIAWMLHQFYTANDIVAYGWRIPFIIGGIFGLVAIYLRRWLQETPVFREFQRLKLLAVETPLKTLVREYRFQLTTSMLFVSSLIMLFVIVMVMTPTLLQTQHHVAVTKTLAANCAANIALCFGCIAAGMLADRIGARIITIGGLALVIGCYYWLHVAAAHQSAMLLPIYALTGFCMGVVGVIGVVLVRSFPVAVRFSGVSLSYNVPYAVLGGLTPISVLFLAKLTPLGPAHYVTVICLIGMLAAGLAKLPGMKG